MDDVRPVFRQPLPGAASLIGLTSSTCGATCELLLRKQLLIALSVPQWPLLAFWQLMHLIETFGSGLGEEELPDLKRAFVCSGREESLSLVLGFACPCMEAEEPRRLGGRADLKLPTTDTAPSLPCSRFVPAWLFVVGSLLEDACSRGSSGAAGLASGKGKDGPGAE